jgi:hypothetical protein
LLTLLDSVIILSYHILYRTLCLTIIVAVFRSRSRGTENMETNHFSYTETRARDAKLCNLYIRQSLGARAIKMSLGVENDSVCAIIHIPDN